MIDVELVPIVSTQMGLVTHAQAREAGLSQRQVSRRLSRGAWVPVFPRVYRVATAAPTTDQRLLAAVLAAGPGAAASHRSAVALWGLRGFSSRLPEVSRPFEAPHRLGGVVVHRYRDLEPHVVVDRSGVPTTTPARTLADLGEVAPQLVRRATEAWLADRIVTLDEISEVLRTHDVSWRRGVRRLRRILADRGLDGAADSDVEALLAHVLQRFGVALPVHHHVVRLPSGLVFELDYAYVRELVALEVDGYGVHLRSREVFEHDRYRQNELEIAGWSFLRFTSHSLRREPERCARQVEHLLARRRRDLAQPGLDQRRTSQVPG